jgi:hypothetical protein
MAGKGIQEPSLLATHLIDSASNHHTSALSLWVSQLLIQALQNTFLWVMPGKSRIRKPHNHHQNWFRTERSPLKCLLSHQIWTAIKLIDTKFPMIMYVTKERLTINLYSLQMTTSHCWNLE